ncbi:MAG: YkvA family protein [Anaerolineae bacterium]
MQDPQVPWATKLIPVLAIIYLLSPVDLIPDTIPLITQIDDLAVLLIAAKLFMELVPDDVDETPTVEASYRVQEGEE